MKTQPKLRVFLNSPHGYEVFPAPGPRGYLRAFAGASGPWASSASSPDMPEGVAIIRKPFSTAALIFAVQSTLAQSAELRAQSRELREQNKQRRSELNKEVQKAFKPEKIG